MVALVAVVDARLAAALAASSRLCVVMVSEVCQTLEEGTDNRRSALCPVGLLQMHLDYRLLRERLVAQRALERALAGVHHLMPHQLE